MIVRPAHLIAKHLLGHGIVGQGSQERDAVLDRGGGATVAAAAAAREFFARRRNGTLGSRLRRICGPEEGNQIITDRFFNHSRMGAISNGLVHRLTFFF